MSAQAFAQKPAATPTGGSGDQKSGDYGYKFEDDPLSAGGFGPNDATCSGAVISICSSAFPETMCHRLAMPSAAASNPPGRSR